MKLLLFSDVHCSRSAITNLVNLTEQVDVVVGAGDFGVMRRGTEEAVTAFRDIRRPFILVPGNAESDEELRAAASWDQAHVLHGDEPVAINGVVFFGLGGGVPITPFGSWSYDLSEEDAEQLLRNCPNDCVLVTHSPPHGVVDDSSAGKHLGSTAIRDTVLRCKPKLAVCGHIHDCSGQREKLGTTTVINAGPEGILWDLENDQPLPSA